jgi:hypothetical protein
VVEPGDDEVERGTSLIISARFPHGVPREATLWIERQGETAERIAMKRRFDDPLFVAHLAQVQQPAKYRIEFVGQASEQYQLRVFEYPEMLQADASLEYPEYTQLPDKLISDTRRVSAVEGTRLTWTARLNKPVVDAWLEGKDGRRFDLQKDSDHAQAYHCAVALEADQQWSLHLRDDAGRSNRVPPELVARVLLNRPPELKPTVARDLSVSPLEELMVSASAWDDFGITRYGIAYAVASEPSQDEVLGHDVAAQKETAVAYELNFESLDAKPDQLLAYHFWAEDIGPDGQPRRTHSDIYFADVRHFEEIFREGQSPPGGGQSPGGSMGQNAQQADQLLEIQKQIISATWNLLRRETRNEVSSKFDEDTQLLVESQQQAIDTLEQLGQRVESAESAQYVEEARLHMNRSLERLQTAADERTAAALPDAISVQQAAYQALLQLRAREHEVVRGSQSSGSSGGGGGSARPQQLQELELSDDANRYEAQQSAAPQGEQEEAARDMRQILSRLRDLARRQQDINKQLRELQMALQQAKTEEEREELQLQLKRLRDQQEQLLRDTDDTQERMDQSRNQRQMQEARQQLEQSRERLQQSSQATTEGNVPEALAAGTRAERQFEETANQLRRQAANQFSEAVEQLRQSARDLENRQEQIGEEMQDQLQPSPGLRSDDQTNELQDRIAKQRQQLRELMDQMQQTIQDAETAEPLLAQRLYDAYRDASQQQVEQSLQTSQQLLQNGFRQEAITNESQARQGIRQLREGVDEAAEAILGDEVEGLRRAAGTLSELTEQLNRELEQLDAERPGAESGESDAVPSQARSGPREPRDEQPKDGPQADRQPADEESREGQQNEGRQRSEQPGQGEQGQGEQGQGEQGDGEPGEGQPGQGEQGGQGGSDGPGSDEARRNRRQPGRERGADREGGGLMETFGESLGSGPLTGDGFESWSDGLRDVEEMVNDSELRSQAAQIRDRARSFRRDMRRRSQAPQWNLVREMIATPLEELHQQVEQELVRRSGQREQLVPVDRDPVPSRFEGRVRYYYEHLGQGE